MRPPILDNAHRWPQRVLLAIMRVVSRTDPDPVIKVVLYRPEFFGRNFLKLAETTIRGASEWTPGERELMAAVVSKQNQCPFCMGVHEAISSSLRSAFEMLEKVTRDPSSIGPEDMLRMRTAGVSDQGIRDALQVGFVFNTINRLANGFDMHWVDESGQHEARIGPQCRGLKAARVHSSVAGRAEAGFKPASFHVAGP